jgi:hypothetical protein
MMGKIGPARLILTAMGSQLSRPRPFALSRSTGKTFIAEARWGENAETISS